MIAKPLFTCTKCGAQSPKWSGRCLECGRWGTLKEEVNGEQKTVSRAGSARAGETVSLAEIGGQEVAHRPTGNADLDRVLGGGLVAGAVILLGGEPGVGKSTLLLSLSEKLGSVLYVAGEESPSQIALRAKRLGVVGANLKILSETGAETVAATIKKTAPSLAIIDSIQTLRSDAVESEAGSIAQVRASAAVVAEVAKQSGVPVILVGQVTKEGSLAGPKTLEHLVDVVLSFEGDKESGLRILRAEKNRFGATDEVAILRMTEEGLRAEENPSKLLLAHRHPEASGSVVTCFLEGSRPLLVEVQALTTKSFYQTPIRRASGYDTNRLQMILAVLERRARVGLSNADVHVNVVGGITLRDRSADLAVALALASAAADSALPSDLVAFGEIGLAGEVRPIGGLDRRLKECAALGFTRVLGPKEAKTLIDALSIAGIGR